MDFVTQFKAARRVSTPLVAIRTFDAQSTIQTVRDTLGEKLSDNALVVWDCVHGFRGLTKRGADEVPHLLNGEMPEAAEPLPNALRFAENARENVTIFVSNAHLFWGNEPNVIQGIWNLRDGYKANGNMLCLLISPGATLPVELVNDVLVLDEPLPTPEQLRAIVADVAKSADLPELDAETLDQSVNALIGLPAFPADQAAAMCIDVKAKCIDVPALWGKKKETISQTPGLTVWESIEGLDAIGGLHTLKSYIRRVMTGRNAPRCIIYTDEIEKAFAGTGTDLSGVKTELTGAQLSWTEDKGILGILLIGFPGCAKSQISKNAGFDYNVPVINFNIAAMQGGIIGQSGAQLRTAQKTVDAVAGGTVLWLASCNSIDALPPELRDRFKLGTFFVDAPDAAERAEIWKIYRAAYDIPADEPTPDDTGWTGRQIKECCNKAYMLRMTLAESATYVVPLHKSAPERIQHLRESSSGKYLSASYPGLYQHTPAPATRPAPQQPQTGRVLRFDE